MKIHLFDLSYRYSIKNIPIEMNDTPLPPASRKKVSYGIQYPDTFIRNDKGNFLKSSFLEIAEKVPPAFRVFSASFSNSDNFPISFFIYPYGNQNGDRLNFPALGALEPDSVYEHIDILGFQRLVSPFLNVLVNFLVEFTDGAGTYPAAREPL